MPELPDITVYLEALQRRILPGLVSGLRVSSPSVLRTFDPPHTSVAGRAIIGLRRLGKRIVIELDGDLFVVLHLMIAGRLRWERAGAAIPKKVGLAAVDFEHGSLILTEQGTRRRAGIWVLRGETALAGLDRGGVEPLQTDLAGFAAALRSGNRTLKRALTDPAVISGVGNAYSDEILWAARLSPVKTTARLGDEEIESLYQAVVATLTEWTERLRGETGDGWPAKVTAFRPEMAVHGRYGQACPRCEGKVARIVYAENETNYCPRCQTGGRVLADRSLSRLLKEDWPRTVEEWEGQG